MLSVGTSLLFLAAVFQLFDGIQGVITGTLRGLGDTRTAMMVNLVAHWLFGLPISYLLCFVARLGRVGTVDRSVAGPDRHRRDFVLGLDDEDRALCSWMVNDAHVHFFSPGFFAGLGADLERLTNLGWEFPESVDALGTRWVAELDKHSVREGGADREPAR